MIAAAYVVPAILFTIGVYLMATGQRYRRRRPDLANRLIRYQPVTVQAQHWLDQRSWNAPSVPISPNTQAPG
jgi:hypothetical protein